MSDTQSVRRYEGQGFAVEFDARRCLHSGHCTRGLPAVFDAEATPWIRPAGASLEAVREAVLRCPTGALQLRTTDGALATPPPAQAEVTVQAAGPLYARGVLELETRQGKRSESRAALCRCGQTKNPPYCDDAHHQAGFDDPGVRDPAPPGTLTGAAGPTLTIAVTPGGPLVLRGNFELRDARGSLVFTAEKAALCRCGGSKKKPFCDASHRLKPPVSG